MEASPITLLRLIEREIAFLVVAYNDYVRLREHYRCRYMPNFAEVFLRRTLKIIFFMPQYSYSFSVQKMNRDVMFATYSRLFSTVLSVS